MTSKLLLTIDMLKNNLIKLLKLLINNFKTFIIKNKIKIIKKFKFLKTLKDLKMYIKIII